MRLFCLVTALFLGLAGGATAEGSHAAQIIQRLENANQWRDHVMVVAHRAGWKEGGKTRFAENSAAAIRNAIELGAEMVELDVLRSKDGEYVVIHDTWLDRTTTCKGLVAERTLAELRQCRLVVEGTGQVTAEHVPTLGEMLSVAKDRILVNIDNKLDIESLGGMVAIARDLGMADQIVIKQNLWNAAKLAEMKAEIATLGEGPQFMPIMADDAVNDVGFLETVSRSVSAHAVEMINWHGDGQPMTETGGTLFSTRARAVAARGDWHIWVNTYSIVNRPGGLLAGGRGDELAVLANFPAEVYGFWVDRGATIIQTDEPKAAIKWLAENGYRAPYDLIN